MKDLDPEDELLLPPTTVEPKDGAVFAVPPQIVARPKVAELLVPPPTVDPKPDETFPVPGPPPPPIVEYGPEASFSSPPETVALWLLT
jgi:hypothetical protein